MNVKRQLAGALSIAALAGGCATPVMVDYERRTRFGDYETFAVESRETAQGEEQIILSPIVDRRFKEALRSELAAKGFEPGAPEKADFHAVYHSTTRTRDEFSRHSSIRYAFGHHGHPFFAGSSHTRLDEYEAGTFVVDIVDRASGQLVWRGALEQRLDASKPPDEAEVRKIVSRILEQFPPDPGTSGADGKTVARR